MGFSSFMTSDTHQSIPNIHSNRSTLTVYMKDNKGNVWVEDSYDGYGVFGGKDIWELIAEMNGLSTREEAIDMYFKNVQRNNLFSLDQPRIKMVFPTLSANKDFEWTQLMLMPCREQGFFYNDDEEEYDNDDEDDDDDDDEWPWEDDDDDDDEWNPNDDRGGTGHGDDSYSDADPGL